MVDNMYAKRRQAALDVGLLWGAYHFATGDDVDAQVKHFLESAEPDETTLMALDHEPNNGNELDIDGAQAFLESGRDQLGRKLVLYSGNLIKEQLMGSSEFFGSHRLWLAQYGPVAKVPPAWKT
jgi:GH25 family lysozyme M1 (1,4-beta-N-acetylmuramidase)